MSWAGILIGALGCYVLKLAGLMIPPRVLENARLERIALILPVGLLGALIAVQTLTNNDEITVDARLAGVAVAIALAVIRAPFVAVVPAACATAAILRLAF